MNLRRLRYFVKSVEIGSLTQAADVLHVAQPALSQQLAVLEREVRQSLLIRNKRGVMPTEAGKVLYRHALSILRQCEQAQTELQVAGTELTGRVSIGLAQFSMASRLAVPLMREVRRVHPHISLYINESLGTPNSEMVMNGRIDMAVIGTTLYGNISPAGLTFRPLLNEELFLVRNSEWALQEAIRFDRLADEPLVLPAHPHFVRRAIDDTFARLGGEASVISEVTSLATLIEVVQAGIGSTILPESVATSIAARHAGLCAARIVEPTLAAPLALCESKSLAMSLQSQAVRSILLDIIARGVKQLATE